MPSRAQRCPADRRCRRRSAAALIVLALAATLAGCGPFGGGTGSAAAIAPDAAHDAAAAATPAVSATPGAAPAAAPATPAASPATTASGGSVVAAATRFMQAFVAGDYADQWAQLDPGEQAIWPSAADRAAFLRGKFALTVTGFQLGTPRVVDGWASHENPAYTVSHPWRVPVALAFTDPATLRPAGVAASYEQLALVLTRTPGSGVATVAGEGPASLDAPLLVPEHPSGEAASVPILMYHRVAPLPERSAWTDAYGYQIEYGLTVTPQEFAAEMNDLDRRGYHAISLTRLADALLYGLPLPAHPFVLTFDDGRQSPYANAVPVLRQHGFTAEFFVCGGFVGETNQTAAHLNVQRYLTWDQVSGLDAQGFWVEDHGQKDQQVLWGMSPAGLAAEVGQSARALEAHTGRAIQFVAYTGALWPFPAADQSGPAEQTLFTDLDHLGYAGGVLDTRVASTRETPGALFQLPRIRVAPGEAPAEFDRALQQ